MNENNGQQNQPPRRVAPHQDCFDGETNRLRRVTSQYRGPHASRMNYQGGIHMDPTHVMPQRKQMHSRQIRPTPPLDANGNPQRVPIPQVSQVGQAAPHAAALKAGAAQAVKSGGKQAATVKAGAAKAGVAQAGMAQAGGAKAAAAKTVAQGVAAKAGAAQAGVSKPNPVKVSAAQNPAPKKSASIPTVAMSIDELEASDGTQIMSQEKKTQASRNASKALYPQETEVMSRGPLPAGARAQQASTQKASTYSSVACDKTEQFVPVLHGNYRSSGKPAPQSVSYSGPVSIPKKKPKGKGKKILQGVFGIILALLLAGCGFAAYWIHEVSSAMSVDPDQRGALMSALKRPTSDAFYMLLLGSDARPGEAVSRADVNILARIDAKNGQVTLISIPRDTMIEIPEYGIQKINAAHATGGPAGAVQAVSDFAGVPISHYAEINFEGTVELIDRLGGIEVNVPQETYTFNGYYFPAGPQTLDGDQALSFARERKSVAGGDFGRAQAQRIVIEAILEKILALPPTQIPGVVQELADCVGTDMSVSKVVELALRMQSSGMTTYSAAAPSYAFNQDGVSYVGTMYAEWRDMMQRVDAGMDPNDTSSAIPNKQLNNSDLGAASNARSPEDYSAYVGGMTTNDVAPLYGE